MIMVKRALYTSLVLLLAFKVNAHEVEPYAFKEWIVYGYSIDESVGVRLPTLYGFAIFNDALDRFQATIERDPIWYEGEILDKTDMMLRKPSFIYNAGNNTYRINMTLWSKLGVSIHLEFDKETLELLDNYLSDNRVNRPKR